MLSISVVPLDNKATNGFELDDYKTTSNKHTVAIDLDAKRSSIQFSTSQDIKVPNASLKQEM